MRSDISRGFGNLFTLIERVLPTNYSTPAIVDRLQQLGQYYGAYRSADPAKRSKGKHAC